MQASPYAQYFNQDFENQPMNMQLAVALKKVANLVEEAKKAIETENYEERLQKIEHGTKIILLLTDSLIESDVPEIKSMVYNISKFYNIILKLFDEIDLKNDLAYADQAIESLNSMAETWQTIKMSEKAPNISPTDHTPPPTQSEHSTLEISA